jgi:phosphoenolpyruvate-protein phosphotransferase (PTS system enzyme I)
MPDAMDKTTLELSGEPVSPGIAIGQVFLFKQINLMALEKTRLPVDDTAKEIERLNSSIEITIVQINQILQHVEYDKDVSAIFRVQLGLLTDSKVLHDIKTIVHEQKSNIEFVLSNQIKMIEEKFRSIDNEVMRTRFLDIQDVYYRILRNLLEIEHVRTNPLKRVKDPVIFVAEKLHPSDIALLEHEKLLGIIIEEGSILSHVAIITKALDIPTIIHLPGISSLVRTGDPLILDALQGKVIIRPTPSEMDRYWTARKQFYSAAAPRRDKRKAGICKTADGVVIDLEANVGSLKEAEEAIANGATGIGLLRTELFYMSCSRLPTVDEEYDFYASLSSIVKKRPITVRLLDLGADKFLSYLGPFKEQNPQLGVRGIRYLLKNPDIFEKHLQSIVRASSLARMKILVPFVAAVKDVTRTLEVIDRICLRENVPRGSVRVGIMVEIPSVALSISAFLPNIDFVNIGTNDLVQYIFAASREDGNVEEYRQSLHPVILRMLANIVLSVNRHKKDLSLCGEMASDPVMAPLLVGLGVRSLSMQPASIPLVRRVLARSACGDLKKLFKKALHASDAEHIVSLLNEHYRQV